MGERAPFREQAGDSGESETWLVASAFMYNRFLSRGYIEWAFE